MGMLSGVGRPCLAGGQMPARTLLLPYHVSICPAVFGHNDPRLATSMAYSAMLSRLAGREELAQKCIAAAMSVWSQTAAWIENMPLARRARASLYHLRLELQHWPTYEVNLRRRMSNFAAETNESLCAIQAGSGLPYRHFSRWRGEKPAFKDDGRKLIAACLLLADMLPGEKFTDRH